MMLPSHLLATLLLCGLVSLVRPLAPREWLLALTFGVVIDVDHLLQVPTYVATHGFRDLTPGAILQWGGAWQGFLHTPWALLVVVPACVVFWSWVPAAFWGLHMVQDFVIARHFVVFGSATEWAIVGALAIAVAAVFYLDRHVASAHHVPIWRHALARVGIALR